jgi:hypothetical protein
LQVVDALSAHFLAFAGEQRVMPVVWQQGLLCFVTRYKHQLTTADRDALLRLTTKQHHHLVRLHLPACESSSILAGKQAETIDPCMQARPSWCALRGWWILAVVVGGLGS